MSQSTFSLADLPAGLWLAIALYLLAVPLLWVMYRRWLARLARDLQALTNELAIWVIGERRDHAQAQTIANLVTGIQRKPKIAVSSSNRWRLTTSLGGNLARSGALFIPGHGAFPTGGGRKLEAPAVSSGQLPFDVKPVIRPLLDRKLWPQGDRQHELSEEEQRTLADKRKAIDRARESAFGKQLVSIAIAERGRLLFEHSPHPITPRDQLPASCLTTFTAATLVAVLARKRRLFLGQAIDAQSAETIRDVIDQHHSAPNHAKGFAQLSSLLAQGYPGRHTSYLALPRQVLFEPLSMLDCSVSLLPSGLLDLYAGLRASQRDLLRLGLLYQRDGTFGDQSFFTAEYIQSLGSERSAPFAGQTWLNASPATGQQRLSPLDDGALVAGVFGRNAIIVDRALRRTYAITWLGKPQSSGRATEQLERFLSGASSVS